MKALSTTIKKLWPTLNFFADKQADRRIDGAKTICPDLSKWRHNKNSSALISLCWNFMLTHKFNVFVKS